MLRRALLAAAAILAALAGGAPAGAAGVRRTVRAVQPSLAPAFPVAAPGGDVWFTETGARRLARVDAGGTLTEYPLPRAVLGDGDEDDLRVETVGPDGRVWFIPDDFAEAIGVLDPATGRATLVPLGFGPGAATTASDGALWVAGISGLDRGIGSLAVRAVRIATDGTRTTVDLPDRDVLGADFALAPAAAPGAVVLLLSGAGSGAGRALQLDARGGRTAITLPSGLDASTGGSWVTTGAAGTFAAVDDTLLRIDPDRVARRVGRRTTSTTPRPIAAGADGSLWLIGDELDPSTRLGPGGAVTPFPSIADLLPAEDEYLDPHGITVTPAGDAWVAIQTLLPSTLRRERLLRLRPSGAVDELDLGRPPAADATVVAAGSARREAERLVRGERRSLRVRVRCDAACAVRVEASELSGPRVFGAVTVRLDRAGTRTVTLRRRASAPRPRRGDDSFLLRAELTDRSRYLRQTVAERGAGRLRTLRAAPPAR